MSQREFLTNIAIFMGGCTLLTIAIALIVGLGACSSEQNGPTAPTFTPSEMPLDFSGPTHIPSEPDPTPAPGAREARGELMIQGNYGTCVQSTSYDRNYMSVWRVHESGAQSPLALYKNGEGNIRCGLRIQIDCTVRESDPQPNHIKAGNLYDFFIGTIECRETPPPPKKDPPCEDDPSTERDECDPEEPPCEPTGEPENECQEWDYDSCSWVGECPPPECEDGEVLVGDQCVPFCTAYPGDPTCAPSCEFGDAVWNGQTWDCPPPPPCEPTGEPLCDGQVWSTESCSWQGECPPPPPACLYEVSGRSSEKQGKCEDAGGSWGLHDQGSFHCGFALPGVCLNDFNLSPGISHEECLTKHDCD